ncbi:MAG: Gfo/Idh/MocA family oxidoreductase [Planctomycetota bacterium]|jgi:predicted dehydrogenase|nr:Gfo/Idh/MocA family oxidoreductase [Planctomycetota bacterium]MDP6989300.1 Gfo/Idh/MocA family oxidoreductase [Planctomycetota bacterium]
MTRTIEVALIGQAFMGRAHSNAWRQVKKFFDLPLQPGLHTVAGRDAQSLAAFASVQGWRNCTTRWRDIAADDEIGLVDVSTPNHVHRDMAIAMLEAGKHVTCEKPLAGTLDDARAMRDAAKSSKARTFVWFNYRRCPAIGLAWQLMREKRIGRVYHVRATYLQSWGGPDTPLLWRFQKKHAGSGAHGDLNAHIVDLARFLVGEEIAEVHGAVERTFVKERTIPGTRKKGRSNVDDSVAFLASFKGGATASFEATRLAGGHLNDNTIEINGEHGSLRWNLENLNELWFYDGTESPREDGWRRIVATRAGEHPYADAWWPDGHISGYEHTFTNQVADTLRVLARRKPLYPIPDFADAYETQRVLEAALVSARERCAVKLSEVR